MRNGNYKIGEAAKRLGMSPRTIRFYESAGLLPPPQRTAHGYASAGHRLFSPEDLRRLQFVKQARLLDLSLDQIRELVEVTNEGCCGAARPHLKSLIREKLPKLGRRIAELRRLGAPSPPPCSCRAAVTLSAGVSLCDLRHTHLDRNFRYGPISTSTP